VIGERCAYCGASATQWDHPSGRRPDGSYFDPDLVLPSCRRCNYPLGVSLWRATGLDEIGDRSLHELRVARLGLALARLPAPELVPGRVDRGGW
jgi:hypothetical protein